MKDEILQAVEFWAQGHEQKMAEELGRWVQIPSVRDDASVAPGMPFGKGCADMLQYVRQRALEMGFCCINHEGYCLTISDGEPQNDDLGVLPHLDVVPAAGNWSFPPFSGIVRNGFIYGRGAHDNKCAGVMGLYLLCALRELKIPLKHKVRLIMGVCEETGMLDMKYFLEHQVPPKYSLVPDCLYPVNFAQKGRLTGCFSAQVNNDILEFLAGLSTNEVPGEAKAIVKLAFDVVNQAIGNREHIRICKLGENTLVTAEGISTHTANPEKGLNAIWVLSKALAEAKILKPNSQRVIELLEFISADYYGGPIGVDREDEHGSRTTLVVSLAKLMEGRIYFNIDARFCLSMDVQKGERDIRSFFETNGVCIEQVSTKNGVYFDPQDTVVQALQESWKNLTGREDQPYYTGGGTYSSVFPNAITYGIIGGGFGKRDETIRTGCGAAHEKDEYIHASVMTNGLIAYVAALRALDEVV
jgi:succinyl-diaminopimelate desuccinylase